jgi:diketogulonate reductase-like aldo/keto reductase
MERDDRAACIDALRRGVDAGMTHIDTAEMYGDGAVEELVGEAIAGIRDRVYLATKVLPSNATRVGTIEACERSLKRLGTDYVDLYILHWPGEHPLEDTIAAFEILVEQGKIRAYGVSNFDASQIEDAVAIAGAGRIACNQVLYHIEERAIEHRVVPHCEQHDIAVVAYSPFGSGDFPTDRDVLEDIARRHDATAFQVALAFLTRRDSAFAIPKSSSVAHVLDNAAAAEIQLTKRDRGEIDNYFRRSTAPEGIPFL